MGRARGDCNRTISRAVASPRARLERLLELATVDALLEPAADLLACGEEIVVAPPAGGEMHDAHALVALTVTAGVGSRFVERPEAVSATPEPWHPRTPITQRGARKPRLRTVCLQFADDSTAGRNLSTQASQGSPQL